MSGSPSKARSLSRRGSLRVLSARFSPRKSKKHLKHARKHEEIWTSFLAAVTKGDTNVVRQLSERQDFSKITDEQKQYSLRQSIQRNDLTMVRCLNMDLNVDFTVEMACLAIAEHNCGVLALITELFGVEMVDPSSSKKAKRRILRDISNSQRLVQACSAGDLELVKLLNRGSKRRASNERGLREASRMGHLEVVVYLHQNGGAGVDPAQALTWAASKGHLPCVQYLARARSSPLSPTSLRKAVNSAILADQARVVSFLVTQGAEISTRNVKKFRKQRLSAEMIGAIIWGRAERRLILGLLLSRVFYDDVTELVLQFIPFNFIIQETEHQPRGRALSF